MRKLLYTIGFGILYAAVTLGCGEKSKESDIEKLCKDADAHIATMDKETEDLTKKNKELADKIKNNDYGLGEQKEKFYRPGRQGAGSSSPVDGR
jgi:hypothetical protein